MAGYVTAVLAFVRAELRGRETNSFCDFKKWPLVIIPHFTPFCLYHTSVFWDVLGKEYYSLTVSKYDSF